MLTGEDENVDKFVKSLEEATKAMRPAAEEPGRSRTCRPR